MFKDNEEKLILKLPFGFRDIFPVESSERTVIEGLLRKVFTSWGYGEVKTPVVEYTKNISTGIGKEWKDKLISFFDVDGNLISLRADMTIPIARLTGMRIKKDQLPVRFYYFANSFRQSGIQKGKKRVLNQAGIELIGSAALTADVEVLAILINILQALGIGDFKIGLGSIKFIEGVCGWFGLKKEESEFLKDNLIIKNLVSVKDFLYGKDRNKAEMFLNLIKPAADLKPLTSFLEQTNDEKIKDSLDYLAQVHGLLSSLGYKESMIIDLSIVRDFDYYSGLLFEVYCSEVTDIIGNGGRYDRLINKFGLDAPATGFALDVDLLHKAVEGKNYIKSEKTKRVILSAKSGFVLEAINFSQELRKNGISVSLLFDKPRIASPVTGDYSAEHIYEVDFTNNKVLVTNIKSGSKILKNINDF